MGKVLIVLCIVGVGDANFSLLRCRSLFPPYSN